MNRSTTKVRTRPTLTALGFTGALLAASATTAGAQAAPIAPAAGEPVTSAYFNRLGGNADDRLVDHLVQLISDTPAGETISGTAFHLEEPRVFDALRNAAIRYVNVEIVVDADTGESTEFKAFQQALAATPFSESWGKRCTPKGSSTACIGDGSMHNKFFTFSKVKNTRWVVSDTSANLNEGSGTALFNSTYTDVGNQGLYDRFRGYFKALAAGKKDLDYYQTNQPEITKDTKSYFYPRATGDTVESTLKETKCPGSIQVGMWSISRGAPTRELRRLAAEGCDVQVVARHIYDQACENLTAPGPGKVLLHGFSEGKPYIHQKNIMMDAVYTGERHKVVFTGSANTNTPSLRDNDENVIRVMDNGKVHGQFVGNFSDMIQAADIHTTTEADCKAEFNGQS